MRPSGIVTFLFTDIEGSTRRWEKDASVMRTALEIHDQVLAESVAAQSGWLFKHTGDGICAAFASPKAAVEAAVTAQRALELPVRMGVATGEAQLRDSDYFGAVLNRAARVMAAGHGGQILLDGQTAGLLSGVDMIELGPRRLRDLAKAVDVFQVRAAGLRTDFPPLRTLGVTLGNLRPQTTSFVGREGELAELTAAVKAHRMVTLTGVGGVGKTRLALETAARCAYDFVDGVFLVELATVGDPAAVSDAVAAVLGITQQPGMTVTDSVATALEGRHRLLVLDNCEHVLEATADLIDAMFAKSSTVQILATSREGLRTDTEYLWPVPTLDFQGGAQSSAAQLFIERAEAVSRSTTPVSDDVVAEICRRLDGVPLAIELAASRMMSMTATELRDRLDDRFRLLVGARRGLDRHQTLRHAVQWSFDLLDDLEKDLLTKCSVFVGGFDLEAARGVTGADDELATLDLLDALVRKSLLVADRTSARTRFSMLETIRQFAEEQLVAAAAADHTRHAHARYFAGRENEIFALWDGPRQREAYGWVSAEMANLRTAFRWAVDHNDLDTATTIVHYTACISFWGDQHEPIRWAEELIEPAGAVQHRRLAQLYGLATLCFTAGRIADAIGYAARAQEAVLSGRFDDVRKDGEAAIACPYAVMGQPERWVDWCRDVLTRRPDTYVHAQGILVLALKMAGADDEATAASEGLLAIADTIDSPNLAAWALFAYGTAQRDVAPMAAYDALRRGLKIAQDSGSRQTESSIAAMLSPVAMKLGEPVDAIDYAVKSLRHYYDSGNFYLVKNPLVVLGVLFERLGHYEPAAIMCGFAINAFTQASLPEINSTVAHLRAALGDDGYESLTRTGEHMSTAEMVAYAFDQIDQISAELRS
jgi:predicted ATPase/tetratricopeptide (TPR) repeat protein